LALGTLPPAQLANASGLYNLMRNLGGAIGIAAVDTVLDSRLYHHLSHLTDSLNLGRAELTTLMQQTAEYVASIQSAHTAHATGTRLLADLVNREATVMAYNDLFWLTSMVFAAAVVLVPLVRKPADGRVTSGGE
jgi:MFS transporter, DHA2 family, multidrug resistance protein